MKKVRNLQTLQMLEKKGFLRINEYTPKAYCVDGNTASVMIIPDKNLKCSYRAFKVEYRSGCFFPFVYEHKFVQAEAEAIKYDTEKHSKHLCSKDCIFYSDKSDIKYHSYCKLLQEYINWTYNGEPLRHFMCHAIKHHLEDDRL